MIDLSLVPLSLSAGQQGNTSWTYSFNTEGNWDVVFGVWKESGKVNSLGHTGWLNDYVIVSAPQQTPPITTLPGSFTLTAQNPVCDNNIPVSPAVRLNWTAATGATSNYTVYRNGSSYNNVLVTDLTFYNNANIVAGQSYSYYAQAKNIIGFTNSDILTIIVPSTICNNSAITEVESSKNEIDTMLGELLRYIQVQDDQNQDIKKISDELNSKLRKIPGPVGSGYNSALEMLTNLDKNRRLVIEELTKAKKYLNENNIEEATKHFRIVKDIDLKRQEQLVASVISNNWDTIKKIDDVLAFLTYYLGTNVCDKVIEAATGVPVGFCSKVVDLRDLLSDPKISSGEKYLLILESLLSEVGLNLEVSSSGRKMLSETTIDNFIGRIDDPRARFFFDEVIGNQGIMKKAEIEALKTTNPGLRESLNVMQMILDQINTAAKKAQGQGSKVLGETIINREYQLEIINTDAAHITTAPAAEIASAVNEERDLNLESQTNSKYISPLTKWLGDIVDEVKSKLNNFISYGTKTTKSLGAGERAGTVNSYKAAFGKLPESEEEWQDVIKIANGRWPTQRNSAAETKAKMSFKKIYGKEANMNNQNDNAAVTVMAYGLRPSQRNLDSEKAAILSFKYFYKRAPVSAIDWDIVRAIAYSGAER